MSLINDVLKDLEQRRQPVNTAAAEPLPSRTRSGSGLKLFWWLGAAVVAGFVIHFSFSSPPASTVTPTNLPLHAAMPEARPAPQPAAESTASELETESLPPTASVSAPAADQPAAEAEAQAIEPTALPQPVAVVRTDPDRRQESATSTPERPATQDSAAPSTRQASQHERQPTDSIKIQRASEAEAPDAQAELDAARRAIARGQHQEAGRRIEALLEREPGHDAARLLLANSLLQRGDARAAARLLDQGLAHSNQPTELSRLLGRILIDRGETARARQVLAAHAPDPVLDPDYHQLLAAAHRQAGDHQAAMESYRQLADIVPGRGAVWIGLGASLEALERNAEAREAYARALEGNDPRAARFARQRLNALNPADGDR